jgi:hypothetical protein
MILAAVFCGMAGATEDLDAALNALKKKAQRRNYSDRAVLHDRELMVPASETEQSRLLDEKLHVMEQSLAGNNPVQARPGPRIPPIRSLPRQEENNNWLTPALLDNDMKVGDLPEDKNPWITQELERQKNRQLEKAALAEEQKLINRQVNDQLKIAPSSPFSPADTYGRSLQNIIGGQPASEPRQTTLQNKLKAPAAEQNPFAIKRSSSPSLLPSPPGSKLTIEKSTPSRTDPFRIKRSTLTPRSALSKQDKTPKPLPPLKKLRRSSLRGTDPFANDYMPRIKKSIWD